MSVDMFNTLIAIMATISLFLFSLQGFSSELQRFGAERMQVWLGKITAKPLLGLLFGATLTAVIQSSSAVSSIVVALVDSGVISFYNSLAVLLGTNIGTTFTAWMITFKLDFLGPYLLITGTIIGFLPYKIHFIGKLIFYLGLILFSLLLISKALEPVKESEDMIRLLSHAQHPFKGVLIGMLVTILVQSSSVTTGLTIVLASQGLLELQGAIAIVVGCNVGTTSTALLASTTMNKAAKLSAKANFVFNLIGLLAFAPFITKFAQLMGGMQADLAVQVATAHLIFNAVVALITFPFLKQIGSLIEKQAKR
jgi:phosphate:Na+ symporter